MALKNESTDVTKKKLSSLFPPGSASNVADNSSSKTATEQEENANNAPVPNKTNSKKSISTKKETAQKSTAKKDSVPSDISTGRKTDPQKSKTQPLKKEEKRMGRPPKAEDEPVYNAKVDVYLTQNDKEKLKAIAKSENRSLGDMTRIILSEYLKNK